MKNSLLALIWAIAIIPATAQKTLPSNVMPYIANWNHTTTKALERAGFEVEKHHPATTTPLTAQNRSGGLQLDSTITYYGYVPGLQDSTPIFRTTYQYPQPKLEIETVFQMENNAWLALYRSNIHKDALGRIVEVYAEANDPDQNEFVPDSRILIYPHQNSLDLIDSFFVFGWDQDAAEWMLLFLTQNQFDGSGRLLESISSFDYFGEQIILKDVHTYDANGDNTLIVQYAVFEGVEFNTARQDLEYQNHLLVQATSSSVDLFGEVAPYSQERYVYTNFGKVQQHNSYEWSYDEEDWVQTGAVLFAYDNVQRVNSMETVVYTAGEPDQRDLETYAYIEDEHLSVLATYFWTGDEFMLSDREYYYYSGGTSSSPEPVFAALPLSFSPNPTQGSARLNLTEPSLVQIFDTHGRLLNSGEYQPGTLLNLNDLPNGLYIVTARTAGELFMGRLVKQ